MFNTPAVFCASFLLANLPITFCAIFLAMPHPVPYWTKIDVNLATDPALSPYTSIKSIAGKAFSTIANVSVSNVRSDNAAPSSAIPATVL